MEDLKSSATGLNDPASVFDRACEGSQRAASSKPIWLVPGEYGKEKSAGEPEDRCDPGERWLKAAGFEAKPGQHMIVRDDGGAVKGVAFGMGGKDTGRPCGPGELLVGALARDLPAGSYHFASQPGDPELAAIAWGLGAYRFERYKSRKGRQRAKLEMPAGVDHDFVVNTVEALWLGRDLINTPACDLGPCELEAVVVDLAARYGATISTITGSKLLEKNFPMIHAVGRASPREPRIIDMRWQREGGCSADAKRVTIVGKGICFDTGGLDLKPSSNMILMKKDMGGAASTLALSQMIMGAGLDVSLRILIAAAENNVDGNAFRPSDVLSSRAGLTVEVGNTDAEGRLVLADALSLADEESPDLLISMATLTGAARVALGVDLPAFFCTGDAFAQSVVQSGDRIGDPVWRMPFWAGYDRNLKSNVADISNISNGPFAGAITAALFLKRFVKNAHTYAHVDMYGWRPEAQPLGPKGGEAHVARTLFAAIRKECGN